MKEVRETLYFGGGGGEENITVLEGVHTPQASPHNKQHENKDFRIVMRSVLKYRQRKFGWHVNATVHNLKI